MENTRSSKPPSLGHLPASPRWEFDASVTRVFDDMLRRSIPQYETMRSLTFDLGCRHVQPGTDVVDLGCARGEALGQFVARHGDQNRYLGVEIAEPMVAAARRRFAQEIERDVVRIEQVDLEAAYPNVSASLTLCVLSLQFVSVARRARVLADAAQRPLPGGALVLVEKIVSPTPGLNATMIEIYHAFKSAQGYPREEIEQKRLALEGVLIPITAHENEGLLRDAGFAEVDCFWRWMNFAGWIAIKGP
jgi:tRNA (cmo5U34)-methyltransferase